MNEKQIEQPLNELEKGKDDTIVKPKKKDGRGKPRTEAQKAATARMLARKEEVRELSRKAKAEAKEKEIEDAVEKRIKTKKTRSVSKASTSDNHTSDSSSSDEDVSPSPKKRPQRKAKKKQPIVQYHNYYYVATHLHAGRQQ